MPIIWDISNEPEDKQRLWLAALSGDKDWIKEEREKTMLQTKEDLVSRVYNDFTYHSPFGDQIERYALIRESALQFALKIIEHTPISREQSLALTLLEQASMMANAAIARNEINPVKDGTATEALTTETATNDA